MKHFFLVLTSLFLIIKLHGQTTWELLIPNVANGTKAKSSFINDQQGWIIMVNQIWHTQDGGITWDKNFFGYNIFQFEFKSENVGYAISQHEWNSFGNEVYKTTDAGITWNVLDVPDSAYNSLYFLNADTGFISGDNKIYKTEDGGSTWSVIDFSYGSIDDFHFINNSIGFGVTGGTVIYKTIDEGITWFPDYEEYYESYQYDNIFFLNEDTGFVYGHYSSDPTYLIIEKTINGGDTWSLQDEESMAGPSPYRITDMIFRNNEEGFAVISYNDFIDSYLFSSDGGSTWSTVPLTGVNGDVFAFDGFNDLYAFGSLGEMYKLPVDSSAWQSIYQPYDGITAVRHHSFATPDTGWITDNAGVLKTADGGHTWNLISDLNLDLIDAVTTDLVFALKKNGPSFDSCSIYKSEDGGINWNLIFSSEFNATEIQMVDQNVGYILSYYGYLLKTTDEGLTWTETEINGGPDYYDMQFLDANEGWALETGGYYNGVYHTFDGGITWTKISENIEEVGAFRNVYFLNSQNGWIAISSGVNDYYETNDGGDTWTGHSIPGLIYGSYSVYFVDSQNGWIVGNSIYETSDGGNTWQEVFYSSYFGDESEYYASEFEYVSNNAIYISGYDETWLAKGSFYPANVPTSNGIELVDCSLFPNPFSSSANIQFSLTENANLSLELFDLAGKKVNTILKSYFKPGTYTRLINSEELPAGCYIIKATASGQSSFIKVIKQ